MVNLNSIDDFRKSIKEEKQSSLENLNYMWNCLNTNMNLKQASIFYLEYFNHFLLVIIEKISMIPNDMFFDFCRKRQNIGNLNIFETNFIFKWAISTNLIKKEEQNKLLEINIARNYCSASHVFNRFDNLNHFWDEYNKVKELLDKMPNEAKNISEEEFQIQEFIYETNMIKIRYNLDFLTKNEQGLYKKKLKDNTYFKVFFWRDFFEFKFHSTWIFKKRIFW